MGLVALHLWIARDVTSPGRGPGDQWGYLGSARFLAGAPHAYVMPHFPYFTYGYSIVLAPLVRFIDDPWELFRAIKVLNAALAAATFPLLYVFGRRLLGAERTPAMLAAAMGSLVWPLMFHPDAILAESLVIPLVVATLLACWLFLTERPSWQRLLFAPSMVWLHVTHNRFAATLLLFFALLLLVAMTRAVPRWLAAANALVAVGLLVGAQVLRDAIVEARWVDGISTPQGPASDAVDVLRDGHLLGEYLLASAGQVWYLAVTTLGLALIGVAVVAARVFAPEETAPAARAWRGLVDDPRRLTLAFLVGMAAAVFATSAYFFTRVVNGSEGYVAGRHNESFVAIWVSVGVLFLTPPTPLGRVRRALLGALAASATASIVLFLGRRGDLSSIYSDLNVPGLAPFGTFGDVVPQRATWVAMAAIVLATVLTLVGVRPTVLLPLMALWVVVGTVNTVGSGDPSAGWEFADDLAEVPVTRAALIGGYQTGVPPYYQYYLPDIEMVPWDGDDVPPEPFVLARSDAGLESQGARIAATDDTAQATFRAPYTIALWVMPGPEQERLDAMGLLQPA